MASKGEIFVDEIQPKKNISWNYISFKETLSKNGSFYKFNSKEYQENGLFPIIDQGEKFISGFSNDESKIYQGDLPVIIFGDHTRNIKFIDFKFAIGADGTKILTPNQHYNPKFYYYYLKSLVIPSFGYSRHYKVLDHVDFPIPEKSEQQRIVSKLDQIFSHLETAKKGLEKIPVLLKQFRQAVLTQAVTGKLTAGKDWQTKKMSELSTKITDGAHNTPKVFSKGFPYIMAKDLTNGFLDFSQQNYIDEKDHRELYSKCLPERGDLLIVNIGAGTGNCVLVDVDFEFSFKNIAIVKINRNLVVPHFLKFYVDSKKSVFLNEFTKGGAQPFLSLKELKEINVKLPALEEQTEIVRRVEALFSKADAIEAHYKVLKEKIDNLPQAVLAKAFRGELWKEK